MEMSKLDKVIKGLEDIQKHLDTGYSFAISWKSKLIRDALELLKEQETEWEHLWDAPDGTYKGRCKKCGFVHFFIENHDGQYRFCPSCGKAVK